jgi:Domain of unknown function (DUF4188)
VPEIAQGRWTHDLSAGDGPVVFLIGMTINKPWRLDGWLPVFAAMGPMLAELSRDPDSGLLGYRVLIGARGPTIVQYWSGVEALQAYAAKPDARHRPAWAAFNRRARRKPGVVGVWHETYPVRGAESIYVDTPSMGLAAAVGAISVTGRLDRARDRLAAGGGKAA